MKQLLTVMAVILCAYFSMGFTVPTNNNDSNAGTNFRSRSFKNAMWVNPWARSKRMALNVYSITDHTTNNFAICNVNFSGRTVDLSAHGQRWVGGIEPGTVVTYQFQSNQPEPYMQMSAIIDWTADEEILFTYEPSVTFQFTVIAGHRYDIQVSY